MPYVGQSFSPYRGRLGPHDALSSLARGDECRPFHASRESGQDRVPRVFRAAPRLCTCFIYAKHISAFLPNESYDDIQEARAETQRLAGLNKIQAKDSGFQRPHLYARQRDLGKDPSLTIPEIKALLLSPSKFDYARQDQKDYFIAQAILLAADWQGLGRVLFHIRGTPQEKVLVVTAFRVNGKWQVKV